jgi:hypothetical protein
MLKKNEDFKEELQTQYTILIKAEERLQKKRTITLYIVCGLTFLMTLISLISVVVSLSNTKKENTETAKPKTVYQTLVTNYNGIKTLDLNAIGNGFSLQTPPILTISNEGDSSLTYNIKLSSIQTSLLSTNNLVYTLTKNNEVSSQKELPLNENYLLQDIKLPAGETVTYKIDVKFNGVLEEGNYSNYYKANIVVEQNNDQANLLN